MKTKTVIKYLEAQGYKNTNTENNNKYFQNEKNLIEFSSNKEDEVRSIFLISLENKKILDTEQYSSIMDYILIPANKYNLEDLKNFN